MLNLTIIFCYLVCYLLWFVPPLTRPFYLPQNNKCNILTNYHRHPGTNIWSFNSVKGPVEPKTGNLSTPWTILLSHRKWEWSETVRHLFIIRKQDKRDNKSNFAGGLFWCIFCKLDKFLHKFNVWLTLTWSNCFKTERFIYRNVPI